MLNTLFARMDSQDLKTIQLSELMETRNLLSFSQDQALVHLHKTLTARMVIEDMVLFRSELLFMKTLILGW